MIKKLTNFAELVIPFVLAWLASVAALGIIAFFVDLF